MIKTGTVIDNRYALVEVVGEGGFAVVYKAIQKQFDRIVAIKVLNSDIVHDSENLARFEREAQTMSTLKHKNVCSIYGFGRWLSAPYMVMEYVQGKSLETILEQDAPLEPRRAARLMRQVLDGLSCAHKAGIIHRDLKPSNIIVTDDEAELPRIIDFGLAKLMPGYGVTYQRLTEVGCAIGTIQYMSPEQCTGAPVDQRADIYAAGCILYQCLTGRPPFKAEHGMAVMFQHLNEPAPHISKNTVTDTTSQNLDDFVQKCMQKNPIDRFADAETAANELETIIAECSDNVRRTTTKPKTHAKIASTTAFFRHRKFPTKAIIAGLSVLFVCSLAICALLINTDSKSPDSMAMFNGYFGSSRFTVLMEGQETAMEAIVKQYELDKKLDLRRAAVLYRHLAEHYGREAMPALAREYAEKWLVTQKKLRSSGQRQQDFDEMTVRVLGLEKRWQEALVITERNLKQRLRPKQIHQWESRFFTMCIGAHQVPKAITYLEDQLSKPGTDLQSKQILLRDIAHLQLIDRNYLAAEKILKEYALANNGSSWRDLLGLCRSSLLQRRYAEAAKWLNQAEAVRVKSWGVHASPSYNILLLKIATSAATGNDNQTQSLIKTNLQIRDNISDPKGFMNDLDQQLCEQAVSEFMGKETLALLTATIKKARYFTDKHGNTSSIR